MWTEAHSADSTYNSQGLLGAMMSVKGEDPKDITYYLNRLASGDKAAEDALFALLYPELRRLAGAFMRTERPEHTLQPTALVNEVYMRLVSGPELSFKNRSHFFATAGKAMRRILIDHARARLTEKRGGGKENLELSEQQATETQERLEELIALDRALDKYDKIDDRGRRVVELMHFVGLTVKETAEMLNVSEKTVKREWSFAKAWLLDELGKKKP